jgi:long-chain acyl-CoA synthetase
VQNVQSTPQRATDAEISALVEGHTVARDFLATVEREGGRTALRTRGADGVSWVETTYSELGELVARATAGLASLGVGRGDRVVLMLRNRPEFHVLDMAALCLGATPISVYNSSAPEQVAYLVGHAGGEVAIVEDDAFLARFNEVRDQLPRLRAVGVVEESTGPHDFTYASLLAHEPADLAEATATGRPEDLATVIYTSGTTGPPKGVMITNANVCWTVESLLQCIGWSREELVGKRMVSYLPMAHIAERMTSHYQSAIVGYEVTTCPDATVVAEYLREVRPNILFGVPRVFEKIHAGLTAALAGDPDKERAFQEAVAAALPIAERRTWGEATEEDEATWAFLDDAAFRPIRELLGLDALDVAISGAAPIPAELLAWFRAIGVPLSEIYGLSETSGPLTWEPYRVKPGTVGPQIPGCEVALAADGEVIGRGGNIFTGYLDDPDKTADALDEQGWLHTGDIGVLDEDGYLRIVDRKKELIITAGGKNISPANLEAALKTIPLVGQACAIGDQRPFVSALVTLDPDVAPVWAAKHDLAGLSLAELAVHPTVLAELDRGLAEVMAPFNNAERVKKLSVIGDEWLPDSDVLTPTSKLKRRGVLGRYGDRIEALYG